MCIYMTTSAKINYVYLNYTYGTLHKNVCELVAIHSRAFVKGEVVCEHPCELMVNTSLGIVLIANYTDD